MIRYKKDTDNIVTLTLDMDGRQLNILNHKVASALSPVIKKLQEEKEQKQLRGIIITSGKKNFLVGGDLDYLYKTTDPKEIFNYSMELKVLLRELESPGVPVVAAINGTALGTGFELALACHHRVVINDPDIKLGLPEVTLGLMPGSGGVIRLMWLLGIEAAFPILTNGKRYRPAEAIQAKIVDELADNENDMMLKARHYLLNAKEGRRPWDRKYVSLPGGTMNQSYTARSIQQLCAAQMAQHYGNFPAPIAILKTLAEGSQVDFDTACIIESRYFTQLITSQVSRNMTKAFWFDFNAIRQGEMRPKGFGRFRPKKVGIIGAGRMGSGIAVACLVNGLEVVLKDVSKSVAQRGQELVASRLKLWAGEGKISTERQEELLTKLATTEQSADFKDCDLVIEAVFENPMIKAKVIKEAEHHIDEYALFASNTVSIPITDLGKSFIRPEHFVGLHFFSPAEEIPLVEIVRGKQTTDETIARAFDFVKKIRKTPIIVKDTWGFYVSRVQNTYILEGVQMLSEGIPPALIENLGRQSGMPYGALALADQLSLDMVITYEHQAAKHYGSKYVEHPATSLLSEMINDHQRTGQRAGKGFYEYQDGKSLALWKDLSEYTNPESPNLPHYEIIERFLFVQVIEAVWCIQEGIIKSVPEANLGSLYGWGFPVNKGGVLQFIEDYGKEVFIKRCRQYEKQHGPRFQVPSLLLKKAKAETE